MTNCRVDTSLAPIVLALLGAWLAQSDEFRLGVLGIVTFLFGGMLFVVKLFPNEKKPSKS